MTKLEALMLLDSARELLAQGEWLYAQEIIEYVRTAKGLQS